jgi:hypothetical protein
VLAEEALDNGNMVKWVLSEDCVDASRLNVGSPFPTGFAPAWSFRLGLLAGLADGRRMSQQTEFLKNVIATARTGNEGAITLLRQICNGAVEKSPPHALIAIAGCLYHLGVEATRTELGRN